MKINTVLGEIDSKDIGRCLMHEHVLCANWTAIMNYPGWINREEVIDLAVRMLKRVKRYGFQTFVDGTVPGLGRDVSILKEVSEKAEMNIIAATGQYWFEEVWLVDKNIDRMADRMIREVEKGIQGTDAKAGIIKCATDRYGLSEKNRNMLQMIAKVYQETGLPVYTHTSISNHIAVDQQQYLMDLGIPANRMVIGHLGDTDNVEFIETILKKGSYAGLDRFGLDWIFPDEKRIDTLVKLIERGWEDKLVLSHDCSVFIDEFDNEWDERYKVDLEELRFQYTHLPERIVPELVKKGIPEDKVWSLFDSVPRKFFEED